MIVKNTNQIGELIKALRKQMGLTQKQLALGSGKGLRFISDLENGKKTCHIEKVLDVLSSLGVTISLTPPKEGGL
jgi:HTH-type transcriptional regulator/antitoxin HipB